MKNNNISIQCDNCNILIFQISQTTRQTLEQHYECDSPSPKPYFSLIFLFGFLLNYFEHILFHLLLFQTLPMNDFYFHIIALILLIIYTYTIKKIIANPLKYTITSSVNLDEKYKILINCCLILNFFTYFVLNFWYVLNENLICMPTPQK